MGGGGGNVVRKAAAGMLIADLVVLVIVLIVLIWSMVTPRSNNECQQLCLPCKNTPSELCCDCRTPRLEEYLTQAWSKISTTSVDEAETAPRASRLMSALGGTEKPSPKPYPMRPAARLQGAVQPKSTRKDSSGLMLVRVWEMNGLSYLQDGMEYRNGRLVVPTGGVYNVYSFLDIFDKDNAEGSEDSTASQNQIQHNIVKYNILDEKETELLSTYRAQSKSRTYYASYDSFLSADVKLNAGDEIYVKTSNTSYLNQPYMNFFGAYLL